jgi:crotonobetainyl-CoA:carnitine CoA-transferase CaiB-like acyl-CoA transferase
MGQYMGWGVYQLFPTQDGRQIFIAVTGNRHWAGLCDALGFDDWKNDPGFNSNNKRGMQKPLIAERITKAVEQLTYDDVAERLYKGLVPYAPVNSPLDLVDERQMTEGRHWLHLQVGDEKFKLPQLPISMGRTDDFAVRQQPGPLGAHTDSILAELGYSAQEIEKLKAARVVLRSDKVLNVEPRGE